MEDWSAELLLHVIQYLNVRDAGRFSLQSRRCYYLVHTYRSLRENGVQLVSSQSTIVESYQRCRTNEGREYTAVRQRTKKELCQEVVSRLQSPPSLVLAVSTNALGGRLDYRHDEPLHQVLQRHIPSNGQTVILGAEANDIQTACGNTSATIPECARPYECESYSALMALATASTGLNGTTTICPFCIRAEDILSSDDDEHVLARVRDGALDQNVDWQCFILFVCGEGTQFDEALAQCLQDKYPTATVVGGICNAAYCSIPIRDRSKFTMEHLVTLPLATLQRLRHSLGDVRATKRASKQQLVQMVHDLSKQRAYTLELLQDSDSSEQGDSGGICGVAIASNSNCNGLNIRSVVSRGVQSLTWLKKVGDGTPQPTTSLFVQDLTVFTHGDDGYMLDEDEGPYNVISSVIDRDTGKVHSVRDLIRAFGEPEMVGYRRDAGSDGFVLQTAHMFLNELLVFNSRSDGDESSHSANLAGANVDLFKMCGEACLNDMEHCMQRLKEATANEDVLGGLLITCNGRGPRADRFIDEDMADARRLAETFPQAPFVGFYAGGEIGAMALAGRQSVFSNEKACLQGFTAVVALFTQPKSSSSSLMSSSRGGMLGAQVLVDDRVEQIQAFVQSKLGPCGDRN